MSTLRTLVIDPLGILFPGDYKARALKDLASEVCRRFFVFGKEDALEKLLDSRIRVQLESPHVRWPPIMELVALTIRDFGQREKLSITGQHLRELLEFYKDKLVEHASLSQEALQFLEWVRGNGVQVVVVANMDKEILDRLMAKAAAEHLIALSLAASQFGVGMPNPLMVEYALLYARTGPAEAVFVGSSAYHNLNVAKLLKMPYLHFGKVPEGLDLVAHPDLESLRNHLGRLFSEAPASG